MSDQTYQAEGPDGYIFPIGKTVHFKGPVIFDIPPVAACPDELNICKVSNDAVGAILNGNKSRGTIDTPLAVQVDDEGLVLNSRMYSSVDGAFIRSGMIRFICESAPISGGIEQRFEVYTGGNDPPALMFGIDFQGIPFFPRQPCARVGILAPIIIASGVPAIISWDNPGTFPAFVNNAIYNQFGDTTRFSNQGPGNISRNFYRALLNLTLQGSAAVTDFLVEIVMSGATQVYAAMVSCDTIQRTISLATDLMTLTAADYFQVRLSHNTLGQTVTLAAGNPLTTASFARFA